MANHKNKPSGNDCPREREIEPRYPEGCPIDGHQGYGCTCNPINRSRAR